MSKELVFCNSISAGYILVNEDVLAKMNRYRQYDNDRYEAGGLLLGFRRGPHLEVVDITTPQPKDSRHRFSFYRCDPLHEKHAKKMWSKSKNTIDYLGEWHTHPERKPHPSRLDENEWKKLMSARKSSMVFLILGTSGNWLGVGEGKKLSRCIDAT